MKKGFTLLELLVVIAIIGILSSVVMVALANSKDKARTARMKQEISQIANAVEIARTNGYDTLISITGSNCSNCFAPIETTLTTSLTNLSQKSGAAGIEKITRDPWGSIYLLDENEGEGSTSNCTRDSLVSSHGTYLFEYGTNYCKQNPQGSAGWQ